jgi:hypothetical protein
MGLRAKLHKRSIDRHDMIYRIRPYSGFFIRLVDAVSTPPNGPVNQIVAHPYYLTVGWEYPRITR